MQFITLSLAVAACVAPALAGPALAFPACEDNCAIQVLVNSELGKAGDGNPGCKALFGTTIVPCPKTVTQTLTKKVTLTGATVVATETDTLTSLATLTTFADVTETDVTTVTSTSAVVPVKKRAVAAPSKCVGRSTITMASVPSYFSGCNGVKALKSACNCIGAPGGMTTTLKQSTVTVKKFATATITATASAETTIDATITDTITVAATTTDATVVQTSVVVVTSTIGV